MEDCQTPTLAQVMEFKYELTPTMVFDPSRLHDAQNLIVNRINVRCFTPTMRNFQSPGLSPINECEQTLLGGVAVGVAANMESLQKTRALTAAVKEEYFKVPLNKTKNVQQKQTLAMQQQQQKQQMPHNFACHTHFVSDSPPVFTLNSTTNSEVDFSIDDNTSPDSSAILGCANNNNSNNDNITVSLNSSNNVTFTNSLSNYFNNNKITSNASKNVSNTNLLDRTMNVSTLLRSVGLEQYIDGFEEQNMDLEQFLNLRAEDIPRLGVHIMEHQKILLDLLNELNGV